MDVLSTENLIINRQCHYRARNVICDVTNKRETTAHSSTTPSGETSLFSPFPVNYYYCSRQLPFNTKTHHPPAPIPHVKDRSNPQVHGSNLPGSPHRHPPKLQHLHAQQHPHSRVSATGAACLQRLARPASTGDAATRGGRLGRARGRLVVCRRGRQTPVFAVDGGGAARGAPGRGRQVDCRRGGSGECGDRGEGKGRCRGEWRDGERGFREVEEMGVG